MENNIDLSKLREAVNGILDNMENSLEIKNIAMKKNFYWEVDSDEVYRMDSRPILENVGSLLDDWGFVLAAGRDKSQALPLVFLHVAPLLRYIAETLSEEDF